MIGRIKKDIHKSIPADGVLFCNIYKKSVDCMVDRWYDST